MIFQPLASAFPSSVMPTAEALAHNDASSDDVFDADFKSGLSSGVGGRDIETKISGPTSTISSGGSRSGPLLQGKHDNISYLKPSPWLPFVPLQAYVEEWQVRLFFLVAEGLRVRQIIRMIMRFKRCACFF